MIRVLRRGRPVLVFVLALALVCVCSTTPTAANAMGKFKSVTGERDEVVAVDDVSKTWTVVLAKDCKIRLNDLDSKIEDLPAGDRITITYGKDGNRLVARSVLATRK